MAAAEQTQQSDDTEQQERPWLNAIPTTRLAGEVVEVFTPQSIDKNDAQTDSSYGIVLRNPSVVIGELFVNEAKEDGLVRDEVDDDSSSPTDYRLVDPDDQEATFDRDGNFKTGEESTVDGETVNTYAEADDFEESEVLLWVSGLAGDRIARTLDFNGRPYARETENGPVYGLIQRHEDWEGPDTDYGQLAKEGKAPRLARPPILRPDYAVRDSATASSTEVSSGYSDGETVLIDFTRKGRSYHGHVFDADAFAEETGALDTPTDTLSRGQYGIDIDSRLDLRQADWDEATETIAAQDWDPASMFHEGDGWGEITDDTYGTGSGTSDSSSMSVTTAADDSGTDTAAEDAEQDEETIDSIVGAMRGNEDLHGLTPDEALEPSFSGFIENKSEHWHEPPTGERLDAIRRGIYEELSWLDVDELE